MKYLTFEEVLYLHSVAIEKYGGEEGILDLGTLKSALERPKLALYGREMYASVYDKAAALTQSLVKNHAFSDGNKRVAAMALGLFLEINKHEITATNKELANFILDIAGSKKDVKYMAGWIKKRSRPPRRQHS